ncbi:Arachidonate 15-lipoxygenase precursor [Enhygromyxa salina]|uniref:Arachidonate 15-lipoxygenase n=1 Tax=Enhygromyxa salina TaxID=215803 RepID=A0A0C2CV93_9BACT|nr:lipoxygenase family protein [Enhygromyxa salina]KIG13505.1 Arachidonate 15-lipoxygenase precursor [Enhygromyxa salina]
MSNIPTLPQNDPRPEQRAQQLDKARETYKYADLLPPLAFCEGVPKPDTPSAAWLVTVGKVAAAVALNAVANRRAWKRGDHDEEDASFDVGGTSEEDQNEAGHNSFLARLENFDEEAVSFAPGDEPSVLDEVNERVAAILGAKPNRHVPPAQADDDDNGDDGDGDESFGVLDGNVSKDGPNGRPQSMDDYANLFRRITLPPIASTWKNDSAFAAYRVAGPNASMIQRITELPDNFAVTDAHYKQAMGEGDSLDAAKAEGRLFLADWKLIGETLVNNTYKGAQKTVYAPLALFAVPPGGGSLAPVAIQPGQTPSPTNKIYATQDGNDWLAAKSAVQVAEGNYHELVSHLGLTHLLLEPIVMATYRQLAQHHPIYMLLIPHFEGTLSINNSAATNLIAPGGAVDLIFAGTIESEHQLALAALKRHDFMRSGLPDTIEQRGVGDTSVLTDYPYRDDGLKIWANIERWVTAYVNNYYISEANVTQDTELQAWAAVLSKPFAEGGVSGFGPIDTRAALIFACTKVIFTASAEHSAVNFPQKDLMSYAPAITGAGWTAAPPSQGPLKDFQPPLELAELQAEFLYLLGGVHHTKLGFYNSNSFPYRAWFKDPKITAELLPAFQRDLAASEELIVAANATRTFKYTYMIPSTIPMSINI